MPQKSTERVRLFEQRNPWHLPAKWARRRCTDKRHRSYVSYGGRGIRYLLTKEEVKELFVRDKAHLLKRPSLERFNADDHYRFENCCFIEFEENVAQINHRRRGEAQAAEVSVGSWED